MGSLSGRQWLILLSVQFTTILFGLTATSVTVILPQLKGALSATQEQISWVLTFNLVATAIATPLTGWLAAKLGWRTLMACSVNRLQRSLQCCAAWWGFAGGAAGVARRTGRVRSADLPDGTDHPAVLRSTAASIPSSS